MNDGFIDFDAFVREVIERAVVGLNDTLKFTEARAQHYAPVRAIFKLDGRTKLHEFPRVHIAGGASSAKTMEAYRRHPISTAAQFEAFEGSRTPRHRINIPQGFGGLKSARAIVMADAQSSALDLVGDHGPRYGHSNSEMPVVRMGDVTVSGDFRRVRAGRLVPTAYAHQMKGGKVAIKPPPQRRNAPVSIVDVNEKFSRVSASGRYEIESGRATYRHEGVARVGGRLKHSIVAIKALTSTRGGTIWGYVRAGGEGVEYARFQEFGTSHHRASPYLRPALYESRERFKQNVEKRLDGVRA